MTPSPPCAVCGHVADLETITPTGIHMNKCVAWQCSCKNTRMVEITHHVPQSLVRRAMIADEMRHRISRFLQREQEA